MKKRDLHIAEPCHASWEAMTGDDARRFCDSCQKHVHHLSGMTRREAERLLSAPRDGGSLCVRYAYDNAGEVRFRARRRLATAPGAQRRGAAELVATASAFAAVLGACAWPSAFAQEEMMGEPPALEYGDGVVQGEEMMPMGQVPARVEPRDEEQGGEPCDGSGDGAWGPMDPLPVQGGMMEPEPWDETLDDAGDTGDETSDIEGLRPTMGRLPVVPSEAIYEQEKQAAAVLEEMGLTLEEEELVDDDGDGAPDAQIMVDRPLPESPWIAAQGGMPAPVDFRR